MDILNILYYTRDEGAVKNRTLSLRELNLRDDLDLEVIFHAVRDAIDTQDLLDRLQRAVWEKIEFDQETSNYIRFKVYDNDGNTNFLKFRKERDFRYERT